MTMQPAPYHDHPSPDVHARTFTVNRSLKFPWLYTAIIAAGTLDVLLTGILLALGGREINPLAAAILEHYGFAGMVVFKYLIVGLVILMCDFVADRDWRKARVLAIALIGIKASPVIWSSGLLIWVA
ncbi:MAG: DUF5658 family protein [Planctomycetota bacterium]